MAIANRAELILDGSGYGTASLPDARLGIRGLGLQHFNIRGQLSLDGSSAWSGLSPLPRRPWIKRKVIKWSRIAKRFLEDRTPRHWQRIVREPEALHFTFDPRVYNRRIRGTVVFEGYWQTERYFREIDSLLREELQVREPLSGVNANLAAEIRGCEAVALHVRHGDNASGVETGMGVLPRSYYEDAIQRLSVEMGELRYFVFSDDAAWARNNLPLGTRAQYVSHNDDMHNYEDLRLMALCKHHIVANSTFSWWGAWLGRNPSQIVYAPRRYWLNVDRPNPELYPLSWRLL